MTRVYNFSAGPSTLPLPVLQQAAEEMLDTQGSGMSVMEMSHRSPSYEKIHNQAIADLRDLLNIPENYKILFLQGGGTLQFSMVPLNLLRNSKKADYIDTGEWSKKAIAEAKKFGDIHVVASSADAGYARLPDFDVSMIRKDADYVYCVSNNTIYGTRFATFPDFGTGDVVCDMSSDILSRPIDVSRFGVIFAGAQKNMGIAGLTVVIIREDLIGHADSKLPVMLDYAAMAKDNSLYNTPPTFAIYMAGLVFQWIKKLGGIDAMHALNQAKAQLLYQAIDQSALFYGTARKEDRSLMNVTFKTDDPEIDSAFIAFAKTKGIVNIKGYRTVGGMRASIYNAMPLEGVQALVDAMTEFETKHKKV